MHELYLLWFKIEGTDLPPTSLNSFQSQPEMLASWRKSRQVRKLNSASSRCGILFSLNCCDHIVNQSGFPCWLLMRTSRTPVRSLVIHSRESRQDLMSLPSLTSYILEFNSEDRVRYYGWPLRTCSPTPASRKILTSAWCDELLPGRMTTRAICRCRCLSPPAFCGRDQPTRFFCPVVSSRAHAEGRFSWRIFQPRAIKPHLRAPVSARSLYRAMPTRALPDQTLFMANSNRPARIKKILRQKFRSGRSA